jgi:hypothetical protein
MCWTLRINHLFICSFYIIWTTNVFCHTLLCLFVSPSVFSKWYLVWILKALCMHIFNMINFMFFLASLIQYIWLTPSNPKWLICAWYTNLTSEDAHIYVEFVLYIVVSLTTLDPISLGTKMYLNLVLGTLEMQWMLVSFIRKVLSPYNIWSQPRMNDKLLSTTS